MKEKLKTAAAWIAAGATIIAACIAYMAETKQRVMQAPQQVSITYTNATAAGVPANPTGQATDFKSKIESPKPGAYVDEKTSIKGTYSNLKPGYVLFVIVQGRERRFHHQELHALPDGTFEGEIDIGNAQDVGRKYTLEVVAVSEKVNTEHQLNRPLTYRLGEAEKLLDRGEPISVQRK